MPRARRRATVNRPSAKITRVRVGLQQVGGERAPLGDDHLRRLMQRRAAHMHRAGAAMPVAALHLARVGLDVAEGVDRQAEQVGGDLRIAGLVALAVRLRAEHQRHLPVRLEADLGALAGRAARGFEKTGDPEPAQPAARRRLPAPRGEAADRVMRAAMSSRLAAKRPQSIVTAEAAVDTGKRRIRLRRRNSIGSMPSRRAARSTSRSVR